MVQVFPEFLMQRASTLLQRLRQHDLTLATAESCTGGLLAALMTELPGASHVYRGGVVCYANSEKIRLGVPEIVLEQYGAVSAPVAEALAKAMCAATGASIGLATTGIAGPGGGSPEKPIGLVFLACATPWRETIVEQHFFRGGRGDVRMAAVAECLTLGSMAI